MNDLEMIKKCAEKMGLMPYVVNGVCCFKDISGTNLEGLIYFDRPYNPLHDDEQAMALVKRFNLSIKKLNNWFVSDKPNFKDATINTDLNFAICGCVARLP